MKTEKLSRKFLIDKEDREKSIGGTKSLMKPKPWRMKSLFNDESTGEDYQAYDEGDSLIQDNKTDGIKSLYAKNYFKNNFSSKTDKKSCYSPIIFKDAKENCSEGVSSINAQPLTETALKKLGVDEESSEENLNKKRTILKETNSKVTVSSNDPPKKKKKG